MELKDGLLIVSTHDLKTNLSKYLRLLRKGAVRGIVVRRYRRQLAVLMPLDIADRFMARVYGHEKGEGTPPASAAGPAKNVDLVHQH